MTGLLSKIWFPTALVSAVTLQMGVSQREIPQWDSPEAEISIFLDPTDTVKYPKAGYKRYWTPEEQAGTISIDDSLLKMGAGSFSSLDEEELDTVRLRPAALDSLIAPDSLLQIDTFRYYYFAALADSLCHVWVRDSLIAALDTANYLKLDSLYAIDSTARAEAAYWAWYATLDKKGKKKADMERLLPIRLARMDSINAAKEERQFIRDSIIENTPRILETFALTDSLHYLRIVRWSHDRDFHDLKILDEDTSYNYRFHDFPFLRNDVNGTWLGVAGSPVQYYDFSKRGSVENVGFYEAQESWSYSPSTLPMYNTKTPYTELAYWGTLISGSSTESDNLHILTTQNITPAFNFCLSFDRFGGGGILPHENTINKTATVSANYLGKKYMAHAGYIYNMVSREENGGIEDLSMVRDTVVDMREASVRLTNASSTIRKHTFFLDQQYRIPMYFIKDMFKGKNKADTLSATLPEPAQEAAAEGENSAAASKDDSVDDEDNNAGGPGSEGSAADSTAVLDKDVTTFFLGHSSEYSTYYRLYQDNVSRSSGGSFFDNVFYYNPSASHDSLHVRKLENKVFARLQPWAQEAAVSKLDVGVGHSLMSYYTFDPRFLSENSRHNRNAGFIYAGVQGKLFKAFDWDAKGKYVFIGEEINDFEIGANAKLSIYPFRRHKTSPFIAEAHFKTSLKEPDYYAQHLWTNHYRWDNDFGKISTTTVSGAIAVPHWKTRAEVTYNLLAGNIWYDESSIVRQNQDPMSILSASLQNSLTLFKLFHADHKLLFQLSSNPDVVPLPMLAANGRYYIQFHVGAAKALEMQVGADVWYNTPWHLPAWNPALGVFHNQTENTYGNSPFVDAFINLQWKRACIFIKWENVNMSWPLEKRDYFSADRYIRTTRTFKFGIFWPFYTQPAKDKPGASQAGNAGGSSGSGKSGSGNARNSGGSGKAKMIANPGI